MTRWVDCRHIDKSLSILKVFPILLLRIITTQQNMRTKIDTALWERREQYAFFTKFTEPFFGITVQVDCTMAYKKAKDNGDSFFLTYLYDALRATNEVEAFRYRIVDNKVYLYEEVHASPTINRPNGTFGFAYMNYYTDREIFFTEAKKEIESV